MCACGKVSGAVKFGNTRDIQNDTGIPEEGRIKRGM